MTKRYNNHLLNMICADYHRSQMNEQGYNNIVKYPTFDLNTSKFTEVYILHITKHIYYNIFKEKLLRHFTIDNNPLFFVKIMIEKLDEAQKQNKQYYIMNLPYINECDIIFKEFFDMIYTYLKHSVPKDLFE